MNILYKLTVFTFDNGEMLAINILSALAFAYCMYDAVNKEKLINFILSLAMFLVNFTLTCLTLSYMSDKWL
jgi:heme/copper-type cytochrome/quinol oxidase subunit 4